MRRKRRQPNRSSRPWRALRVVRLFVLFVAMNVTGGLHVVADAFFDAHDDATAASSCPTDDDDSSCPPGCPTCHCAGQCTPFVPPPVPSVVAAAEESESGRLVFFVRRRPRPERSQLYRPPRA